MNKQFLIGVLATLALSVSAVAQRYQAVPREQRMQYVEATILAVQQAGPLRCYGPQGVSLTTGWNLLRALDYDLPVRASNNCGVQMSTTPTQSFIKISCDADGEENRVELEVETDSTRTSIISLKKKSYLSVRRNEGNLIEPNVVLLHILHSTFDCETVRP